MNKGKGYCKKMGHNIGCLDCEETIFVPNYFDIEDMGDLRDGEISKKEFTDFMVACHDRIAVKVSDIV